MQTSIDIPVNGVIGSKSNFVYLIRHDADILYSLLVRLVHAGEGDTDRLPRETLEAIRDYF